MSDKTIKDNGSIMIRFTKKKKWLKSVIEKEATDTEESRNHVILEALAEKFAHKNPKFKTNI